VGPCEIGLKNERTQSAIVGEGIRLNTTLRGRRNLLFAARQLNVSAGFRQ